MLLHPSAEQWLCVLPRTAVPHTCFWRKSQSSNFYIVSHLYGKVSEGFSRGSSHAQLNPHMALKLSLMSSFQKVQDYLRRFESIPDMLELDHLTVSGDVTFGKNVSLKVSVQWGCCCNKPDRSLLLGCGYTQSSQENWQLGNWPKDGRGCGWTVTPEMECRMLLPELLLRLRGALFMSLESTTDLTSLSKLCCHLYPLAQSHLPSQAGLTPPLFLPFWITLRFWIY